MTEWALAHPWMTLVLVYVVLHGLYQIAYAVVFRLPNRWLRSRNIVAKGWPPEHCDADGDFEPRHQK